MFNRRSRSDMHESMLGIDRHPIMAKTKQKTTKNKRNLCYDQHLHMEYIFLSGYYIPEPVVPIMVSLIEGCC